MKDKELAIFVINTNYMENDVFKKDMILFGDGDMLSFNVSLFKELKDSLVKNEECDLKNEI